MKRTVVTKLQAGEIVEIRKLNDGSFEIIQIVDEVAPLGNDAFVLVKASELSLEENFLKHIPRTGKEQRLKDRIIEVIKNGVKDFYKPRYDPSFTSDGKGICFEAGREPAVGKNYNWWKEIANNFDVSRGSRIGTASEYIAFLGVLIKTLINNGWPMSLAWTWVCDDSRELGHYWNSTTGRYILERTGSKGVGEFYDLANTFKILTYSKGVDETVIASGSYSCNSSEVPLADLGYITFRNRNFNSSVAWIVLEK